jgi:hypothetical protein
VVPGFAVHRELANLVAIAHLTPYEALRAATVDAAALVGGEAEWGTIAAGRRADLLLLDGNPLDDVANGTHIVGVMARGRWHPRQELDGKLEALAASFEQPSELPVVSGRGTFLHYDIAVRGTPFGKERVIADFPNVRVDSVEDPPDPVRTTLVLNGPYTSVTDERPEGATQIRIERRLRDHLVANGTTPYGTVAIDRALPEGALVVVAGPAGVVSLGDRITSIKPGETRELHVAELSLEEGFEIREGTWRVERLPGPSHTYAIEARLDRSIEKRELMLDRDGFPRLLVVHQRRGPIEYLRRQ